MSNKPTTYADAGVDIAAGNALVENIKPFVKATHRPEVLTGIGGFGALFEMPKGYEQPVLVSCTDGVGTKVKLAESLNKFDTIGIDLVAMCVNDLIVCGAEPLFFLDYYACGKLNVLQATQVVKGISDGLQQSGAALVGGETAEMPGVYQNDDFDMAGFCVGVVEKSKIIDGSTIKAGDVLIGLASSGPHSNGYSLIRKLIADDKSYLQTKLNSGASLADALMEPTRIYVSSVLPMAQKGLLKGMAHITGGGITENLPRTLPKGLKGNIDESSWQMPEVFQWLQAKGQVDHAEMLKTFNCGVGMILVVDAKNADEVLAATKAENSWIMGTVV
jgi:phosphoribosylformylglycinamidine cyclo-ligase